MANLQRTKSLLGDLGKSTLRGVRKCPQCGTYNGTRSITCKNAACSMVFKESNRRAVSSALAVRVNTGASGCSQQLYSVRLRDRGPDYRGFVQVKSSVPLLARADVDGEVSAGNEVCYVDSCPKSAVISPPQVTGGGEGEDDVAATLEEGRCPAPCQHVRATQDCLTVAEPLILKNSVLNSLQVSNEIKQSIWLLATETTGPLVQRVSKHVMVVKCKSPRHPLGFLHFMFYKVVRGKVSSDHRFTCSCRSFKSHRIGILREELQRRCIHFYACICAFASDKKLSEEFGYYITLHTAAAAVALPSPDKRLTTIPTDSLTCSADAKPDNLHSSSSKRLKREATAIRSSPTKRVLVSQPEVAVGAAVRKNQTKQSCKSAAPIDESKVSISFHQNLASITERINQTMHYQFEGKPEPLVFHLPQTFFDCLQQRISTGIRKKRLPNSTTAFVRKDALPVGTFSKYTWQITNVLHVKKIFDTTEIPLEITRNFIQNRDGTYDLFEKPKNCSEGGDGGDPWRKAESRLPIRPFELKTFLKVGNTSPDQKEPTPFVIEWIPDILPRMRIGELRLKFEFGHQRNGQVEQRMTNDHPNRRLHPSVI